MQLLIMVFRSFTGIKTIMLIINLREKHIAINDINGSTLMTYFNDLYPTV